ncbi:MAG: hypothetical protein L0H19_03650, partial [Salinisphaera sp.]|nr:hypothetical protein [Salinisphaera sp.]
YGNHLTNVDGFSSLSGIGGSLDLSDNDLTNVDGLWPLRLVGNTLSLVNNDLRNVDGLALLRQVGGDLRLNGNPNLTDISGLGGIRSVRHVILSGITTLNPDGRIPAVSWLCWPENSSHLIGVPQAMACEH